MRRVVAAVIGGCVLAAAFGTTGNQHGSTHHGSTHHARRATTSHATGRASTSPASTSKAVASSAPSQAVQDAARGAALLRVDHVVDGDTVALADGRRVRMAQIDTPEKYGSPECYGQQASATLRQLVPAGSHVRLVADPNLDATDRYGRLVRYVYVGSVNINLEMVRRGAASVWFYQGVRGVYADRLMRTVTAARRSRRGLWGACAGTSLNPEHGVSTGSVGAAQDAVRGAAAVSSSSARLPAAPPFPPDVDCSDLPGPVRVTPSDPHHLDRDGDGIGCNS